MLDEEDKNTNSVNNVIDETIDLRRNLLRAIEDNEGDLASVASSKKLRIYTEILNGMDAAVLGRARAEVDETMADTDKKVAAIAAKMAENFGANNPFEGRCPTPRKEAPKLPEGKYDKLRDSIPEHVLEKTRHVETVSEFNKRMGDD